MKYIIAGTDRPDSNTLKVAQYIQKLYKEQNEDVEIIDLRELKKHLHNDLHYGSPSDEIKVYINKVLHADGLIVVSPEYNGSMPGILKFFIDHLKFPDCFEYRPVCFVGLGGMFGALRPIEHLQQVFGYRNAFVFPERVFLMNVSRQLEGGEVKDEMSKALLAKQVRGFQRFTRALSEAGLDANAFLASRESGVK